MRYDGKHLGMLVMPQLPANFAWGDDDGKTLYMTARSALYRVRLEQEGVRPQPALCCKLQRWAAARWLLGLLA